jgi:hypothetical protein
VTAAQISAPFQYATFASKPKRRAPIADGELQKSIAPNAVAPLVRLLHMLETGLARRFGAAATREERPIDFDVQRHDRETKRRGSFS